MNVVVKLFGSQSSLAGRREYAVQLDLNEPTVAKLREQLAQLEPRLAPTLPCSRFALNHAFASDDAEIHPGDEVALIGMLGGG